ncbi:hypothetical protein COY28_02650 [Candidatus Woesearchaeota archaeon CG_4_10_14_0_2_um_filter_57_5]|nr:MAG: hypothetical protein AUJ68_01405 [Candidatus Woesearchaeota archaeon CG1_02_57_44]PIN67897.1 MAG: hypothetical protein COV94_06520 [Candidatus Woesearchaeota archaeon CG11_big_fil_rev_8_21_14_0_20_57_5]PIZ54473.1 MAG: hypothetical protein COY28_02650 [Candidatus Woesearchaeota archaeon CG_4_10_14_0_2_um_filter_57_5]
MTTEAVLPAQEFLPLQLPAEVRMEHIPETFILSDFPRVLQRELEQERILLEFLVLQLERIKEPLLSEKPATIDRMADDTPATTVIKTEPDDIKPHYDNAPPYFADLPQMTFYSRPQEDLMAQRASRAPATDLAKQMVLNWGGGFASTHLSKEASRWVNPKTNRTRRWLHMSSPHTDCELCALYGYWYCPVHQIIHNKGYSSKKGGKGGNSFYYSGEVSGNASSASRSSIAAMETAVVASAYKAR